MYENKSIQETCSLLNTHPQYGLSPEEAQKRLTQYGKNVLPEAKKESLLSSFLAQLQDPLIYVLLAASAVSLLLDEVSDTVIILFVVLMNAVIGMLQEGKAQKALDSLKKLTSPRAVVIRGRQRQEIPASDLTMGDIVVLDAGCQVPADLRLIESENLKIEESALTGESVPVDKKSGFLSSCPDDEPAFRLPLGDRLNMAYMSTIVTYGRGCGIVTATGPDTEIGRIASLISEAPEDLTPLQKRLGELGVWLSVLTLLLCALLFSIGLMQRRNLFDMLLTAISLAVAAVPEGLPAIVTICLALSVTRMVKANTIIRRLPSVETLGTVNVVCSDKTGTLTQNRMKVLKCFCDGLLLSAKQLDPAKHMHFLQGMTLCNDAGISERQRIGDPTELALLDLAALYQIRNKEWNARMPRIGELPFDSDRKMMTTRHRSSAGAVCYTKGAPDEVLKKCTTIFVNGKIYPLMEESMDKLQKAVKAMSSEALRVLAIAMRSDGELEEADLTLLGLAGMQDPARPEAARTVQIFRDAGVRTVMITGDHIDTAYAIAKDLGIAAKKSQCMSGSELARLSMEALQKKLDHIRVFARISPEQKVKIVKGFQQKGDVVSMTGDGVNDAPSLKTADIGIAMGLNGTDVAKQASDMILTDDNFATIQKAIEEGRGVYENIKKSVIFLLSSNLGEILTMFAAVCCGLASPLKSSHILWINLITDSLPALALGIDANDGAALMKLPPRQKKESLFAGGGLSCTCFYGFLIAVISLTAFFTYPYVILQNNRLPLTLPTLTALLENKDILIHSQTYAFTVLGVSQLFHAVGMRDIRRSLLRMDHLQNPLMLAALAAGFLLQFAVTEIPVLIRAFGTIHLLAQEWVYLTLLSAFPLLAHELLVFFFRGCRGDS